MKKILQKNSLNLALVLALLIQSCAVVYYIVYLQQNGYLPSPFVYDKSDTFMDLYNTLWWAGNEGRYSVWGSVYPPLNFLILKLVLLFCYPNLEAIAPVELRQLQLVPAILLSALHLLAPFIVINFRCWKAKTPLFRIGAAVFVTISPPLLFSLERGNLIIVCLFLLPFVFKETSGLRTLAIALLINIKPYFAILLFGFIITGDIMRFLQTTALSGAIFLFTGLMLDANFPLFLTNLFAFADNDTIFSGREVLALPSSVSAFSYVLKTLIRTSANPSLFALGIQQLSELIEFLKAGLLLSTLALLIRARRSFSLHEVMVVLMTILINAGVWVGGYSQIFYFACIPVVLSMHLRYILLPLVTLIFVPLDLITLLREPLGPSFSFISNSNVNVVWQLGLGSLMRPILNALLLFSLALECVVRISQKYSFSILQGTKYS